MTVAVTFVPGHITGFFEICDQSKDPLRIGSRGAGISISKGVKTVVEVKKGDKNRIEIYANNKKVVDFKVTENVVRSFMKLVPDSYHITVKHEFEFPVGAGFGASGGGALGAALAMNKALKLGLSTEKVAQFAHVAEVMCGTGLGDVSAQLVGGLEIRKEPGAPGIGVIEKIPIENEFKVICTSLGTFDTKTMITNPSFKANINRAGKGALGQILADPTPKKFIELSKKFAIKVGFVNKNLQSFIKHANNAGAIGTSVKKKVLFSFVEESFVHDVFRVFRKLGNTPFITDVDEDGARNLN
jgi:pantoate kinase